MVRLSKVTTSTINAANGGNLNSPLFVGLAYSLGFLELMPTERVKLQLSPLI